VNRRIPNGLLSASASLEVLLAYRRPDLKPPDRGPALPPLEKALRSLFPLNKEKPPISEYEIKLWATLLLAIGGPGRRQRSDAKLKREADLVSAESGEPIDQLSPVERLASIAATAFLFFAGKEPGRSVRWFDDSKPGGAFHEFLKRVFEARGVKANADYHARKVLKHLGNERSRTARER
jgi:hypothetical protein